MVKIKKEDGTILEYDPTQSFESQDITVPQVLDYPGQCPLYDKDICEYGVGYCLDDEVGECPEEKVEEAINSLRESI